MLSVISDGVDEIGNGSLDIFVEKDVAPVFDVVIVDVSPLGVVIGTLECGDEFGILSVDVLIELLDFGKNVVCSFDVVNRIVDVLDDEHPAMLSVLSQKNNCGLKKY